MMGHGATIDHNPPAARQQGEGVVKDCAAGMALTSTIGVNHRSAAMRSSAVVRFDAALHGTVDRASRTARIGTFASRERVTRRRRELLWAWLSVAVLVLCWDAAARLDQQVSRSAMPAVAAPAQFPGPTK
jgi:hypothetical protein